MKKLILIPLMMVAIGAFSQTLRIKSYLGDSITVRPGYKQLTPIIVTPAGDTARFMTWKAELSSDSTSNINLAVRLFDRNAAFLDLVLLNPPQTAYNKNASFFTAVQNYVHQILSRFILH